MPWLNVLTVGLVMTSLWYAVPSGALNAYLANCDRKAMTYITDLDFDEFEGRWYEDYVSETLTSPSWGVAFDVRRPITPSVNNRGEANPTFMVIAPTFFGYDFQCSAKVWLYELREGRWSNVYSTQYYDENLSEDPGYYVKWWDKYVLATDYNTTAVTWTEPVLGGYSNPLFGWIEVLLREPGDAPNAEVVEEALDGFCTGDWLDVNSDRYHLINNDVVLTYFPCFQTRAP